MSIIEDVKHDYKFKVVLLGEGAVGKSSLVMRYVKNKFTSRHLSTIQASFQTQKIQIDDDEVELNIWDTAGQEKYHALGPIYYRGSNGVLLIFDVTDQRSFEKVKMWVRELRATLGNSAVLMIVGNKIDMENERTVSRETAEEYAKTENAFYSETSAKENIGISTAFETLTEKMIEHNKENARNAPPIANRSIQLIDENERNSSIRTKKAKCC
ncbi:unnamed protein product [Caenorhabditis angaria]|uniref:Ras-related protein Rab-21 n=1 Tax=Caenorhabditis angaria TaxID=860376 RepID=A0A9P1IA75_9PELO|nr:unnamed protein product [Caenorhabditis angaria]